MQERRRYIRIPEGSQISYEVVPNQKTRSYVTKDISQGGIRFFVHEFISKNSILRIKLTLRDKTVCFEAMVKLVWIREVPLSERYEIGVEFINLPGKAAEYLIGYIESSLGLR